MTEENEAEAEAAGVPFLRRRDEGEAYHALGALALRKATPEETGGAFDATERRGDEGRVATPLHVHRAEDELWYVVAGEAEFVVGDESFTAGPGDTVFAPRNVPHAFRIAADGTRVLLFRTPGTGPFLSAVGTRVEEPTVPADGPDEAELSRLDAVLERNDVETLGPPPFDS
jgi:mannose-6-phosphate isomerase-like protein (cupin superfamily)